MATQQQSANSIEFKPETATAVSTAVSVRQQSCQTLDLPALDKMTADELADFVIEGMKKFNHYLPYIFALKKMFEEGERDNKNRLKVPIKGCHTWSEFCLKHLDRTRSAINKAIDKAEVSNRELALEDSEAEHSEDEGRTDRDGHKGARGSRCGAPQQMTPLQELQKLISRLCPSAVDGKEHRLIQLLVEVEAKGVAESEAVLGEIVVGMLRNAGNTLVAYADRLESRSKLAEAA